MLLVSRIIELIICSGLNNIDLGLIGDESLTYLAKILESPHKIQRLSFGEGYYRLIQIRLTHGRKAKMLSSMWSADVNKANKYSQ